MIQVYQCRENMAKTIPSVVEPEIDKRIVKMESLVGKYGSATLIDSDLTDWFEFPTMKRKMYMEDYLTEDGNPASRTWPDF